MLSSPDGLITKYHEEDCQKNKKSYLYSNEIKNFGKSFLYGLQFSLPSRHNSSHKGDSSMKPLAIAALAAALCLVCTSAPAANLEAQGRALLNGLGCKACHSFDGQGGQVGPALDAVGKRLSQKQIRRQLVAPREVNPKGSMPSYDHLGEQDLGILVDFLARQK
ncbi:MAG: c-type cytochrome [Desulfuromonadales bacterium]|nr:c-type cytochrome [Desulfuromonadales bacterium]